MTLTHAVLFLKLIVADVDYDGSYTYLFSTHIGGAKQESFIAYTADQPLVTLTGAATVTGTCESGFGIDEAASKRYNQWVTYTSWVCTATEVRQ